jgi:pimeloyl-ACP methyl ester carboxylesterase
MSNQRTHDVATFDGVTIRGAVCGQGPPLVFLPGGIGDGDLDWPTLLPTVTVWEELAADRDESRSALVGHHTQSRRLLA